MNRYAGVGHYLDNYLTFIEQSDSEDELLIDAIKDFAKFQEGRQAAGEIKYLGSSALLNNRLIETGLEHHSTLFELDHDVCRELKLNSSKSTTIHCSSGYEGARNIKDIDLLFIDPPDLKPGIKGHFQRYKNLLFHCYREHIPYVSWNPLYADQSLAGPSLECRIVNETAVTSRFI